VDANTRHAKMIEAQKVCWDLPREQIFEAVKAQILDYRNYHLADASLEKGRIEMFPREEEVPKGEPAKRHQLVVQLVPEAACTKVMVTALVEYEYSKKRGFEPPEHEEQAYGIRYDATLKIDETLRAIKTGAPTPTLRP